MNELLARIRANLDQRTPRERWMLVLALGVAGRYLVYAVVVSPLGAR